MALLYRMGTGNGGSDLKPYTVNFSCDSGYVGQTLTMHYLGTETVADVSGTVANDGTLTLYPMYSGNWKCSCYSTATLVTMEKSIELTYWGIQPTITFVDIPNGSTATANDVKTWLHCANIWDKDSMTLSQIASDSSLMNSLVQNNNANNYLIRSVGFADTLCDSQTAMTYIGMYSTLVNEIMKDATWSNKICTSKYFESVLKKKCTYLYAEDKSTVDASSELGSGYYSWNAFDGYKNNIGWHNSGGTVSGQWILYNFKTNVVIKRIEITNLQDASPQAVKEYRIEGYNGTTWVPVNNQTYTRTSLASLGETFDIIDNDTQYEMYRLYVISGNSTTYVAIGELQMYGY